MVFLKEKMYRSGVSGGNHGFCQMCGVQTRESRLMKVANVIDVDPVSSSMEQLLFYFRMLKSKSQSIEENSTYQLQHELLDENICLECTNVLSSFMQFSARKAKNKREVGTMDEMQMTRSLDPNGSKQGDHVRPTQLCTDNGNGTAASNTNPLNAASKLVPVPETIMSPDYRPATARHLPGSPENSSRIAQPHQRAAAAAAASGTLQTSRNDKVIANKIPMVNNSSLPVSNAVSNSSRNMSPYPEKANGKASPRHSSCKMPRSQSVQLGRRGSLHRPNAASIAEINPSPTRRRCGGTGHGTAHENTDSSDDSGMSVPKMETIRSLKHKQRDDPHSPPVTAVPEPTQVNEVMNGTSRNTRRMDFISTPLGLDSFYNRPDPLRPVCLQYIVKNMKKWKVMRRELKKNGQEKEDIECSSPNDSFSTCTSVTSTVINNFIDASDVPESSHIVDETTDDSNDSSQPEHDAPRRKYRRIITPSDSSSDEEDPNENNLMLSECDTDDSCFDDQVTNTILSSESSPPREALEKSAHEGASSVLDDTLEADVSEPRQSKRLRRQAAANAKYTVTTVDEEMGYTITTDDEEISSVSSYKEYSTSGEVDRGIQAGPGALANLKVSVKRKSPLLLNSPTTKKDKRNLKKGLVNGTTTQTSAPPKKDRPKSKKATKPGQSRRSRWQQAQKVKKETLHNRVLRYVQKHGPNNYGGSYFLEMVASLDHSGKTSLARRISRFNRAYLELLRGGFITDVEGPGDVEVSEEEEDEEDNMRHACGLPPMDEPSTTHTAGQKTKRGRGRPRKASRVHQKSQSKKTTSKSANKKKNKKPASKRKSGRWCTDKD